MSVPDPSYIDREQTLAKHFILRKYLQELAYKILNNSDIAYIDGFSGPWQSARQDYSDTSFMIALEVLRRAQLDVAARTGVTRSIRCFFSEVDTAAYAQLQSLVSKHHAPSRKFEVRTFNGKFEDAIDTIDAFVGQAFPLIFIDPTGWTGYSFEKIGKLFDRPRCEVVINFMYSFVSRFIDHSDDRIIASMDAILGGPGWKGRLDPTLSRGLAVEKLFRDTLREAGSFKHVVSTRIDRSTEDRPHFFLAYGTKNYAGLKAFRQIEWDALRDHARNRAAAKGRKREKATGTADMFSEHHADVSETNVEEIVSQQRLAARGRVIDILQSQGSQKFETIVGHLLEQFMIRETDVKQICVALWQAGVIENTWGSGNRRPDTGVVIRLANV